VQGNHKYTIRGTEAIPKSIFTSPITLRTKKLNYKGLVRLIILRLKLRIHTFEGNKNT